MKSLTFGSIYNPFTSLINDCLLDLETIARAYTGFNVYLIERCGKKQSVQSLLQI